MSRVLGQLLFAAFTLLFAVGLSGAVWWIGRTPRTGANGAQIPRGREPRVLIALIIVIFAFELAAVLACWPTA